MFNIEKYLEKFSKNAKLADLHKEKITEIIEKHTGLYILPKNIEIKEGVLYVMESPAVKNKLFIYKAKILDDICISIPIKITNIQ